jgi:hypothetical protein
VKCVPDENNDLMGLDLALLCVRLARELAVLRVDGRHYDVSFKTSQFSRRYFRAGRTISSGSIALLDDDADDVFVSGCGTMFATTSIEGKGSKTLKYRHWSNQIASLREKNAKLGVVRHFAHDVA